jgi:hypothetical protein
VFAGFIAYSYYDLNGKLLTYIGIGAFIGMLPALFSCLPVHGEVSNSSLERFIKQIQVFGFIPQNIQKNNQFYVHKSPRGVRWDSNCITISEQSKTHLKVTVPLYVYILIKKIASN